jgi:hypothetical protein
VEDDHQLQKILSVKAQGCEVNVTPVKTLAKKPKTLTEPETSTQSLFYSMNIFKNSKLA